MIFFPLISLRQKFFKNGSNWTMKSMIIKYCITVCEQLLHTTLLTLFVGVFPRLSCWFKVLELMLPLLLLSLLLLLLMLLLFATLTLTLRFFVPILLFVPLLTLVLALIVLFFLWFCICEVNAAAVLYPRLQIAHWNGFMWSWVFIWILRWSLREKADSQWQQR